MTTFRMVKFWLSATKRLPAPSLVTLDTPSNRAVAPVPSRLPDPPRPPARRPRDGEAVPLNETLATGPPTERLAVRDPLRVLGAKATAISQLAPGCSVAPQPFDVIRKSAASVP
jgi:hypothetical protein